MFTEPMSDSDGVRLNSALRWVIHPDAGLLDYNDGEDTVPNLQGQETDLKQPPLEHGECSTG